MVDFIWDKKSQRYRYKDSGKFVSKEAIENLTKKAIAQIGDDLETVADLLVEGKISLPTWTETTAKLLKNLHTYGYLLGAGGQKQMNQGDYGSLGLQIAKQYRYLYKFAEDIKTKGMSVAQFKNRLRMYFSAATGTLEQARMRKHRENGYRWERRIRTKQESCQPCISYASLGWQPIGTLPAPTQECDCLSNCGCYKEFFIEKPQDFFQRRWGWIQFAT